LPIIDIDAHNTRACIKSFQAERDSGHWSAVDNPGHGDCVLMSQSMLPTHVGVWLDVNGGGVLHCAEGMGVIFSSNNHLNNIFYKILGAYKWMPR
jgi:hypothetical protein